MNRRWLFVLFAVFFVIVTLKGAIAINYDTDTFVSYNMSLNGSGYALDASNNHYERLRLTPANHSTVTNGTDDILALPATGRIMNTTLWANTTAPAAGTVFLWVMPTYTVDCAGDYHYIFNWGTNNYGLSMFEFNNGNWYTGWSTNPTDSRHVVSCATMNVTANIWNLVVITYNTTGTATDFTNLWVNGVNKSYSVGDIKLPGPESNYDPGTAVRFDIGRVFYDPKDANLKVSQFTALNKTLTAAEIRSLWTNGSEYPTFTPTQPYSNNTYTVEVRDLFNDGLLASANVTFYNATATVYSALTDGTGTATVELNASTAPATLNYNVTKTNYYPKTAGAVTANTTDAPNMTMAAWTNLTVTRIITNVSVPAPFNLSVQGGKTYALTGAATNIYLRAGAMNFTFQKAGWYNFSWQANITALTNTTGNASGAFNHNLTVRLYDNGGSLILSAANITASNSTYSFSDLEATSTGVAEFHLLQNYTYDLTPVIPGYAYGAAATEYTPNTTSYPYNFTFYTTNSINFTFLDEEDYSVIDWTTVYFEIISEIHSANYTTSNGTAYIDLLTPATYNIRYVAAGFAYRFYTITIEDTYHYSLNLTLLNETSATNVTITVEDTLGNALPNATVKILKYDVVTNSYILNQVIGTNFEGKVVASILLNSEYYIFIVEYEGSEVYETAPTYVYATSFTLRVPLASSGFEDHLVIQRLSGQITHSNTTNLATYVWNDENNVASQGCLYAYLYPDFTLHNSTCVSTAAGSTTMYLDNATGATYILKGYVTASGDDYLVATLTVSYKDAAALGGAGPLYAILLLIVVVFIGLYSPAIAVLFGSVAPLLMTITGLWAVGYSVTVPLLLIGLVITYLVGGGKQ